MNNRERFIEMYRQEIKQSLKDHFSPRMIARGEGGWKLDLEFIVGDIIRKILGIDALGHAFFNTAKESKYKLRVDYIYGDWYLVPFDAEAVFYDVETEEIVIDEAPKKPKKGQEVTTKMFLGTDNRVFLGYL